MTKTSVLSRSLLTMGAFASLGAGVGVAALASADSTVPSSTPAGVHANSFLHLGFGFGGKDNDDDTDKDSANRPVVMGTIASINGKVITVTGNNKTTYTVNLSNATLTKTGAIGQTPTTTTLGSLAVGDKVAVMGTVSGTSVTATSLTVVNITGGWGMGWNHAGGRGTIGTVSAINGSTLTVAGEDGGTYTVNASASSFKKVGTNGNKTTDSSLSAIAVGDRINVRGSIVTANLTAKEITTLGL